MTARPHPSDQALASAPRVVSALVVSALVVSGCCAASDGGTRSKQAITNELDLIEDFLRG